MLVTDSGVRNDYNRLNNLGFFEKVDVTSNPGPDPKKPAYVTLKWSVKEQRTGTAQIGAGYSGGLDRHRAHRQHLVFAEQHQRHRATAPRSGSKKARRSATRSSRSAIPYLGNTEKSKKYSLGHDDLHAVADELLSGLPERRRRPAPASRRRRSRSARTIPVSIVPADPTNYILESGVAATYQTGSTGFSATLGRRLVGLRARLARA